MDIYENFLFLLIPLWNMTNLFQCIVRNVNTSLVQKCLHTEKIIYLKISIEAVFYVSNKCTPVKLVIKFLKWNWKNNQFMENNLNPQ